MTKTTRKVLESLKNKKNPAYAWAKPSFLVEPAKSFSDTAKRRSDTMNIHPIE